MRAACLVCGKRASGALGLRLRRRNTNAIWAPNLGAYLCDLHSISGAEIEIRYQETATGRVVTRVLREGVLVSTVDHAIGGKATVFQETLL